jgi:hypothetical protein
MSTVANVTKKKSAVKWIDTETPDQAAERMRVWRIGELAICGLTDAILERLAMAPPLTGEAPCEDHLKWVEERHLDRCCAEHRALLKKLLRALRR